MLVRALKTLRLRSFLCLNNLVGGLGMDDLGGATVVGQTWANLGR